MLGFFAFGGCFFEETWAQLETRLPCDLHYDENLQVNLCQKIRNVDNFLHTKLFRIYKIILDTIKDKMYNFINK